MATMSPTTALIAGLAAACLWAPNASRAADANTCGYSQGQGGWYSRTDRSGPYALDSNCNASLLTSIGTVKETCLTPAVTTSNAYGANYVVSGLLTFPNALPPSGRGALLSVNVRVNKVESMGFKFSLLSAPTTATTWSDHAVANINAADASLPVNSIFLAGSSTLGSHTTAAATGISQGVDMSVQATPTSLVGVLTTNGALTNNFTTNADLSVCVDVIQFP